ncbi:leucine-rich repeat domain-containing protein [Metasolibacillus meyeri]|uniref:Leucine-rich repeat domain-containing protein n=1 Tax=Metasolibacillus meyeri TaxID=1071052 RepID=A0AAW9NUD5_9BACL|nr:leucine-rich repeat domain-containing protein [Metasolibacillus meyeri]MEC1178443.1 leucine-rich repeat domain-containing protein [Metasolibacillus meyeri]
MKKLCMVIAVVIFCFVFIGTKVSAAGVQAYGDVLYEIVTKPNGKKEVIIVGKNGLQKNIVIPATIKTYPVTEIASSAFYTPASDYWSETVPINKNEAYLAQLITSVTIPNSVKRIGHSAFLNNQLTDVQLPANLEEIGNDAFSGNQLTKITLPSKLKSIGLNAFSSNKLTTITVPNSVTSILGDIVYGNPIKSYTLPDHLQIKKDKLYQDLYYTIINNNGKKEIKITGYNPKTTKTTLTIPAKINNIPVTEIGHFAFTPYLTPLGLEEYDYTKKVVNQFSLPNSIRKIGISAFNSTNFNQNIEVALPTNLVEIGDYAFANNNMSNAKKQLIIPAKVKSIGKNAFLHNQLRGVTIPNSVTTLGEGVFSSNSMNKVVIGSGVTSIPDNAFFGNKITMLTLPKILQSIGNSAFAVNQLPRLVLPNNVVHIGANAFSQNVITSVSLPNKLATIEAETFTHNKLKTLVVPASVTSFDFSSVYSNSIQSVVLKGSKTTVKRSYTDHNIKGIYTDAAHTKAWSAWDALQNKPVTLYMQY